MAYIKVDHSKFEETASEIDSYVSSMKKKMRSANQEIITLSMSWQGADFNQFKTKWDEVDNADSTHTQMIKALESYAVFLRYAAGKYKDAQAKAVNKANSLPRY